MFHVSNYNPFHWTKSFLARTKPILKETQHKRLQYLCGKRVYLYCSLVSFTSIELHLDELLAVRRFSDLETETTQ